MQSMIMTLPQHWPSDTQWKVLEFRPQVTSLGAFVCRQVSYGPGAKSDPIVPLKASNPIGISFFMYMGDWSTMLFRDKTESNMFTSYMHVLDVTQTSDILYL